MGAFERVGAAFHGLSRRIGPPPSPQELRVRPWHAANGDATLRVNYDLDPMAIVLDVGGYEGDWTIQIAGRYGCTVHVFEPVPEFAAAIQSRVGRNPKVHVHPFGLAGSTRSQQMTINANRSSIFTGERPGSVIRLVDIIEFLETHEICKVDLLKINIEGGEYELLDRVIQNGYVSKIQDIQVQFHDFIVDAEQRMRALQQMLEKTHSLTYQFPFVWENWRRKAAG